MVIAAKIRGTFVEHLVEQKDTKEGIQLHKSAVREVQEKVWVGAKLEIADQLVHVDWLLKMPRGMEFISALFPRSV